MGLMKKYSQFLKELPSKTVVFAFGRFNPPTSGHELLVKVVKKLAVSNKAEHAIYASKSQDAKKNPLPVDKKVHYLDLMFPSTNFVAANANVRTFIEAAKELNKKYKNLIMVAGSDRVPEYQRILNTYNGKEFNFDTVQVISAGERDPDADDASGMSASKMRSVAAKGDYNQFKQGLPSAMREIDGRRLMNDVRHGMGLETVKEQINLVKDDLREQYFRGEIFNLGDVVESAGIHYEIVKRGSNHLLLKEESGKLVSKWLQDVALVQEELKLEESMIPEELTDKTLKSQDKIKVARIIATMLGIDNAESSGNPEQLVNLALRKVRTKTMNKDSIAILNKMLGLADEVGIKYDATLKPAVMKEDSPVVDKKSNYNMAKDRLRFNDYKKLNAAANGTVEGVIQDNGTDKISDLEGNGTIGVNAAKKKKLVSKDVVRDDDKGLGANNQKGFDAFFEEHEEVESATPHAVVDMSAYETDYDNNMGEEEISDAELDAMAAEINDIDDIIDMYDEDELALVDDETGEEITDMEMPVSESALMEVLSRMERMKAKVRMARSKSKRERKVKVALRTYSSGTTINKRARRLAVSLMKKRLLRGRDPAKVSIGEKERIERTIQKRSKVVGRLAMKLTARVRGVEKARMSHKKFTGAAPTVSV